ncbi:DUF456 domain-containing protein [Chloroflexota bacterium]
MITIILAIICAMLMLVGLLGVVLPILPGIPLSWLGLFIYAIGTGFDRISLTTVIVFLVLMLLTLALDFALPMLGAKKYKASRSGIFGAFLGFTVGIFVLGIWGVILGPLIGAFLGELLSLKRPQQAFRSAMGAFLGFVAGILFKIVVILTMAGFFIASLF